VSLGTAFCFGLALLFIGVFVGWIVRGFREDHENAKAVERIRADLTTVYGGVNYPQLPVPERADTPVQRETTAPHVFETSSGQVLPSPRTWDKRLTKFGGPVEIPYEELEGMFLDQFLLRFFHSLMPETWGNFVTPVGSKAPWPAFVWVCPWATEMPLLFEQATGYKLNELQLNNAIAEWARRLQKTPVSQ
jgi:hypothetical protein